jgi:hypothetical protein
MSSPSSYTYSLVLPGLYLGGDGYLKDPVIIDEAGITHIVSIGDEYGFVQSLPYVTVCWLILAFMPENLGHEAVQRCCDSVLQS